MLTVYVSIGNSDDKLGQAEWSDFVAATANAVVSAATHVHGVWMSPSDWPWQNACWCVELQESVADELRAGLAEIRARFRQDSVAWAVATTEFI